MFSVLFVKLTLHLYNLTIVTSYIMFHFAPTPCFLTIIKYCIHIKYACDRNTFRFDLIYCQKMYIFLFSLYIG